MTVRSQSTTKTMALNGTATNQPGLHMNAKSNNSKRLGAKRPEELQSTLQVYLAEKCMGIRAQPQLAYHHTDMRSIKKPFQRLHAVGRSEDFGLVMAGACFMCHLRQRRCKQHSSGVRCSSTTGQLNFKLVAKTDLKNVSKMDLQKLLLPTYTTSTIWKFDVKKILRTVGWSCPTMRGNSLSEMFLDWMHRLDKFYGKHLKF